MLSLIKTYQFFVMVLFVFFVNQTIYSQDISVVLSELESTNLCIGDTLKLDFSVIYDGNISELSTGILTYHLSNEANEEVDTFYLEEITLNPPINGDTILQGSDCLVIDSVFAVGANNLSVSFTSSIEETILENNVANDTITIKYCGDFQGILTPLAPEQDTLTCVTDSLFLNGGVRYNGEDSLMVDMLFLNYGFDTTQTPIHRDTFTNRLFIPGEIVWSPFSESISNLSLEPGKNSVVIWPTVYRTFLDTTPENNFAIDSTNYICTQGDFEGILTPLAPEQDTLTCVTDSLFLNGGVRYNGDDSLMVEMLFLNYGFDTTQTPIHRDTFTNRLFIPGEIVWSPFSESISNLSLEPGKNSVVIWPTVYRTFLDTTPENDFAIDSTNFGCTDVDFSTMLDINIHEDSIICIGDTLMFTTSIRYHGEEEIMIDSFYLHHFFGSVWAGHPGVLTPTPIDTLLNRTFAPNQVIERTGLLPVTASGFVQGSTGYICLQHALVAEHYRDTNISNNFEIDSFNVGECIPLLPLNLISFAGWYMDEQVELDWQVSLWDEGSHFDIERSRNGFNFEFIDKVNAIANEQANRYKYIDNNPYFTTSYYRLKMVDINGIVEYSPTVAVKKDNQNTLGINQIYVDDKHLNITYSSSNQTPLRLSLYDIMGRLVHREVITNAQIGFNQKNIDVRGLNSGVYILSLQSENELISRMFSR